MGDVDPLLGSGQGGGYQLQGSRRCDWTDVGAAEEAQLDCEAPVGAANGELELHQCQWEDGFALCSTGGKTSLLVFSSDFYLDLLLILKLNENYQQILRSQC